MRINLYAGCFCGLVAVFLLIYGAVTVEASTIALGILNLTLAGANLWIYEEMR